MSWKDILRQKDAETKKFEMEHADNPEAVKRRCRECKKPFMSKKVNTNNYIGMPDEQREEFCDECLDREDSSGYGDDPTDDV